MKKTIRGMKKSLAAMLALAIVLLLGTLSAAAYGYELSVSPGNGQLDEKQDIIKVDGEDLTATATSGSTTVTVGGVNHEITRMPDGEAPESSKYYMRGLKIAGEDNDLVFDGTIDVNDVPKSSQGDAIVAKYSKKDTELVIAYGLKSEMVEYTINYTNAATGEALAPTETHYGTIGSDPIISYLYVDGFLPNAYAATKTLSSNKDDNVFTFWYYAVDAQGNVITVTDLVPGAPAAPAGAGAAAGAANGPADVVDLNDNDTPLAEDVDDNKTPGASMAVKIGAGVVIAAAIAAIAAYIIKKRSEDDDEEDDEDE